jgi:ATP-dependent 26S proteasome regulatory subunit
LPRHHDSEAPEISRNLLLYGPPGTGKTFIAEQLAKNETLAYSFVSFETVIFTGSSKEVQDRTLRNAMKILRTEELKVGKDNSKPVAIIIDELDSVGTKDRSGVNKSSNVEVNNIQKMIDEIHRQKLNIIIIGITNYLDLLEPALIRSGRLGRQVKVDYPTSEEIDKLSDYLEEITKKSYKSGDKNVV